MSESHNIFSGDSRIRVLVLWSGDEQYKPAQRVSDYIARELLDLCECKLALDRGVGANFDELSKKAINEAHRFLFIVRCEIGATGASAKDEKSYIRRLIATGEKASDSIRYVCVNDATPTHGVDDLPFRLSDVLGGLEVEPLRKWIAHGAMAKVKPLTLNYPDIGFIVESPKISALSWAMCFQCEGVPPNKLTALRQAVRQLEELKALHSIHSTIGPAINTLCRMLPTSRSKPGRRKPKDRYIELIREIRPELVNKWRRAPMGDLPIFEAFISAGILPIVKILEGRGASGMSILGIIAMDVQLQVAPTLPADFEMQYCFLEDSIHRLLVSDEIWKWLSNRSNTATNSSAEFWHKVLSNAQAFYLAFARFLLAFVVLFGVLKIQKSTLTADDNNQLNTQVDLLDKLVGIVTTSGNQAVDISDALVKQSNALILDYIEALGDFLQEDSI